MDVIGGVKYMGNRPGGRKPAPDKGKPARKDARNDAADKTHAPAPADHFSAECDARLGQKVDTTA